MNSPASPASSSPNISALLSALSSPSLWKSVGVGTVGAFLGFVCGEPFLAMDEAGQGGNLTRTFLLISAPIVFISLFVGMGLLILDNVSSLRGKWHRDLAPGVGLFVFLGLVSSFVASLSFAMGTVFAALMGLGGNGHSHPPLPVLMLVRGLAWTVFGAGIGTSIGILRSDNGQMARGAVGGIIGGFIGGALFDPIYFALHDNGTGVTSRALGFTVVGLMVGGATRLVQETLKSAWLLGISTGPYEGKEYSLGKTRLTVGRGGSCDLSLFKDESLAPQLGALVFIGGNWYWQGEPILLNGQMQSDAQLLPGSRLQIGATTFRFNDRSKSAPRDTLPNPTFMPGQSSVLTSSTSLPAQASPVAPKPLAWTFSPAVGNSLTGFRLGIESGSAMIGRAEGNDWQLKDEGTSSRHARLERTTDGLALTDLASTNGTWINGQKMAPNTPVALGGGETIRFGRTQWMVRRGG